MDFVSLHIYNGKLYKVEAFSDKWEVYECDLQSMSLNNDETVPLKSTARELQPYIATWYVALRTIALVGLLSVLVYIGIRIILSSSSSQDKAKYKNMLKDWLVAICILFVLHYIMAFMLEFVGSLNNIIEENVVKVDVSGNQSDKLMSEVRKMVGESYDDASAMGTAGYTVMYLALVILTGIFTVQYLKRVIYMAFLTMIAPMIALTYPLDKIKDGKAQAFSFWLREYIFNCLIQPVHLLLYTLLITNAIDFATENILYAIVALAFLVPAEKFIKEMFGMKSQSPVGTLGAAAGGALVMSMLNKMKARPPKEGSAGGNNPNGVRTATRNVAPGGSETPTPSAPTAGAPTSGIPMPGAPTAGASTSGTTVATGTTPYSMRSGLSAVGKKYIYGPDALKSHGKKFTRAFGGAALGLAAGTVAFAAQMADGDLLNNPEKALQDIGVTAGIGYATGSNLTGGTMGAIERGTETFKEGAYGSETYNNMKFDKAFYKSDGYKQISQDATLLSQYGNAAGIKTATQQFLDNGITDTKQIRAALQAGISGDTYKQYNTAGISDADQMDALNNAGITPQGYETYTKEGISNIGKIIDMKNKHPGMSDSERANWMNLARSSKGLSLDDFKTRMVGRTFSGITVTDNMAEQIYRRLVDFF